MATHRLTQLLAEVSALLDDGHDLSLIGLERGEAAEALLAVQRLADKAGSLRSRVLLHAADVRVEELDGAKSAAHWLAHHARLPLPATLGDLAFARSLDERLRLAAGYRAGAINTPQARTISTALNELPGYADAPTTAKAEELLTGYAADHTPKELKILGRRILHIIDPTTADAEEAKALAREEREAWDGTKLTLHDDGEGSTHLHACIPTLNGEMLRKALLAHVTSGKVDGLTGRRALGKAFTHLIETLNPDQMPTAGGANATVVVTMTAKELVDTLGGGLDEHAGEQVPATLDTGARISPGEARRLACQAGILPAILGGKSDLLDLGRRQRLFSKAQRTALTVRDRGCTATGCEQPPSLCHAHHDTPWSAGGATDLTNARLLCPHHHRRIHDPAYEIERRPDNRIRFTRRRE